MESYALVIIFANCVEKMIPFTSFQLTAKETRLRNYTSYGLLIKGADTSLEQDYSLSYVYVGKIKWI